VGMYGRPANAVDTEKWEKAVKENPDPQWMVPVLAVGFDDVQKRVEAQSKQTATHIAKLKELQSTLQKLQETHTLSSILRLQRIKSTQTLISHRLLRLCTHLHLLIPSIRSSSIKPEEEALRTTLEGIEDELRRRPGGGGDLGKMRGRLNELWARVGALQAMREKEGSGGSGGKEWTVVDDEGLMKIANVLMEEQTGLAYLTKILQEDMKDITVLEEGTGSTASSSPPSKATGAGYKSASGLSSSFLLGRTY